MIGVLVAMAVGIVIGIARGGSFRRLDTIHLRRVPVVFAALACQIAGTVVERAAGGWLSFALAMLAYAGIAWFAYTNRTEIGMPIIVLGALSNFAAIVANGGMPVSLDAMRRAGQRDPFHGLGGHVKGAHIPLRAGVRLRPLTDIIPLRYGTVVSVGDMLLWAGLILLLQQLLVGPRGRHLAGSAKEPQPGQ
jgi:hypothetical protein